MKKLIQFLLITVLSSPLWGLGGLFAQYPTLLKDINTVGNSIPYSYCKVNNTLYFSHNDEVHGVELWRTDGTATGTYLVKDVNTGFVGSFVRDMVEFNGSLYFAAYTNGYGYELWKSDGTEAGTVMVKDINPGVDKSSSLKLLTNCGNYLLFTATNGVNGNELWKSDGTTAGTTLLADITVGNFGSDITEIFYFPSLFSNNIYFTIQNSTTAKDGIWRTTFSCVFGCSSLSIPTKINNTEGARDLINLGLGSLIFRKNVKDLYKFDGTTVSAIKIGTNTTSRITKLENWRFITIMSISRAMMPSTALNSGSRTARWLAHCWLKISIIRQRSEVQILMNSRFAIIFYILPPTMEFTVMSFGKRTVQRLERPW